MRIILGDRQTGKTTDLVRLAAEQGGYIICHSEQEAHRVFREAHDQGIQIAQPITFEDLLSRRYYGRGIEEFYIDNADMLLRRLCVGVPLEAITLTSDPQTERLRP